MSPSSAATASPSSGPIVENQDFRLLVVDDNEDNLDMLSRRLKRRGFQVLTAEGGAQALDILDQETVDLVLLDINLPRMNGLELLTKIREDQNLRHLIVFVLTTSNDEKDKFEAFNMNVAGYMLKSDMGNSFIRAVELIDSYWRVVEFPEPNYTPALQPA